MTLLIHDPIYLEHDTGNHPECAQRLAAIESALRRAGLWERCRELAPRRVTRAELERVHAPTYLDSLERMEAAGGGYLDADTVMSARSLEAARFAAGGVLAAVDAVARGDDTTALCLVRPPGHHATPTRAMGFCLYNNVAIAAAHLVAAHGLERVLVVDWDVHHGNGTQDAFYDRADVMYFSIHRYPFYPGTGATRERGTGAGLGFTVNRPFPHGTPRDKVVAEFRAVLEKEAEDYRPQFVLISAGFDAYRDDPIGGLDLEPHDYRRMTDAVVALARRHAQGRVVSAMEGGYHLEGLGRCVAEHLEGLLA